MKYKEILKKREKQRQVVETLKLARDYDNKQKNYDINKMIQKEKFKYKIYNQLLKECGKIENKN